jgi:hypothetical protein
MARKVRLDKGYRPFQNAHYHLNPSKIRLSFDQRWGNQLFLDYLVHHYRDPQGKDRLWEDAIAASTAKDRNRTGLLGDQLRLMILPYFFHDRLFESIFVFKTVF